MLNGQGGGSGRTGRVEPHERCRVHRANRGDVLAMTMKLQPKDWAIKEDYDTWDDAWIVPKRRRHIVQSPSNDL